FGEYPSEAYLCVNGLNAIDFGATDADGDSLVYSLVDAIRGNSTFFDPDPIVASPKPWDLVPWEPGYSADNQVGGLIPISIDSETGLITAQPELQGVFTVAVKVDEYRDGILIGTIRRELQLSSTPCDFDFPSVILTPNGETEFDFFVGIDSCLTITITDPNIGDSLFVSASSPLLDGSVEPQAFFPDATGESQIVQDFCWQPSCLNLDNGPFPVTFTAFSLGCAAEPFITELTIFIDPFIEEDEQTFIEGPIPGDTVFVDLYNDNTHCFDFVFGDPNIADTLIVNLISSELENQPVEPEIQQGGQIVFPICWDVECADVRPEEAYSIDFAVTARNCEVDETVIFSVPILVDVPTDIPSVFSEPNDTIRWQFYSSDTLCIDIDFTDANFFDTLSFTVESEILNPFGVNPATFGQASEIDFESLEGRICWAPLCEQVREEPYVINYTGFANSCRTFETTEFTTLLFLELPPETPPFFELPLIGFDVEHSVGDDPIEFDVLVRDPDPNDLLTLSFSNSMPNSSNRIPEFEGVLSGTETVFGEFFWVPDCPDVEPDPYVFTFTVNSSSCQKSVTRTFEVPITVTTPTLGIIEPIQNIFTPNGDGRNEVWTIENKDDPCLLNFKSVVYDRWGIEVFQSSDPAFDWNGEYSNGNEASPGQYFQTIEYFYKDRGYNYNGTVTLSR
ncbi:MAG: gliding motility-associated C-terminal domain-containing protein, partial [Bacteroidota bacterium]